ncbi:MAG: cbb3-type cytochrome c oxidase subunit I [Moheibacter sp.]
MKQNIGIWFVRIALLLIFFGLIFGHLASHSYRHVDANSGVIGFLTLRPLHVSSAYLGIISAGVGFVSLILQKVRTTSYGIRLQKIQLSLWMIALAGIFFSYFTKDFGGREYWEFNPIWAIPLFLSFAVFLLYFIHQSKLIKPWPVYYWMWFTGIVFFMFCFLENYLWIFPYFKNHFIADMTIQWKVNGSLVGAINQIIYGVAFYLMAKISGSREPSYKKEAFAMYFLGLFNLMFNWGHHIYLLPTEKFIHYIAYAVSMTEWIILIRIFYLWKKQVQQDRCFIHFYPYRFLMASDYWVVINLVLALFMSIPAFNLYTHGTHITVAHSMGTTIGINSMIILATAFYFIKPQMINKNVEKFFKFLFWFTQTSLFIMLLALTLMGVHRSMWQNQDTDETFRSMFMGLVPYINIFIIAGVLLFLGMGTFVVYLFLKSFRKQETSEIVIEKKS